MRFDSPGTTGLDKSRSFRLEILAFDSRVSAEVTHKFTSLVVLSAATAFVDVSSSFSASKNNTMFGWGVNDRGQLGLVPSEFVPTPQPITFFKDQICMQVACSLTHAIFLLGDGSVYTAGDNGCSQLGREGKGTTPGRDPATWSNTVRATHVF